MGRLLVVSLILFLGACAKKEDAGKRYQDARDCYTAAVGYKAVAESSAPLQRYDDILKRTSKVIDEYEADAPALFQIKPGDAYRFTDTIVGLETVSASTPAQREALQRKYLSAASGCDDRF